MSIANTDGQSQRFFVTGTDTDAGKTYCSTALLRGLSLQGVRCTALKPIASGVDADGLNPDAKLLASATAQQVSAVNPLSFALPTAPHLAAQAQKQSLSLARLDQLLPLQTSELQLIEGAGGWLLPLNDNEYMADWVVRHRWPVLLVVGVKLGCLNHSLLTVRELRRAGVPLLGYVANVLTPQMHYLDETLADLATRLQLPLLATLPFSPDGADETLCVELATQLQRQLAAVRASAQ
jgi:dethiobiotin synthetase